MSTGTTQRVYGYTCNATRAHLLSTMSDLRGTCGVDIVSVPDPQPTNPRVCARCARFMASIEDAAARRRTKPVRGECPECGGDVALDQAGLVRPHGQYRMAPSGAYRSLAPCPGKGLEPAGE